MFLRMFLRISNSTGAGEGVGYGRGVDDGAGAATYTDAGPGDGTLTRAGVNTAMGAGVEVIVKLEKVH
jgi:hypothetical protein